MMSIQYKRTWAQIDLDALVKNYEIAKERSGGAAVMPIIKADAYGHGAIFVAEALEEVGANYFAVSCLDEALQLREVGINAGILILGYTDPAGFEILMEKDITQTLPSVDYAKQLSDCAKKANKTAKVHIKIDTGMARLGLDAREEERLCECAKDVKTIIELPNIYVEGIFTHFATADIPNDAFCTYQGDLFGKLISLLEAESSKIEIKHTSNSGGIINHPEIKYNMVRQGIMLYGGYPDESCPDIGLTPVMEFKTLVAHKSVVRKGQSVSYGRTFFAERDFPCAVLPVGYADGYFRTLSNKASVCINGILCPIVGRVCMDQMMVDISEIPDVKIGDEVTLFGGASKISAADLARAAGTINYELLCAVGRRVPRIYYRDGKPVSRFSYIY